MTDPRIAELFDLNPITWAWYPQSGDAARRMVIIDAVRKSKNFAIVAEDLNISRERVRQIVVRY